MNLDDHLRRQAGVVSHNQARSLGMSDEAIRWRVDSGRWVPPNPAAFAVGEPTPAARVHAVALWAGPEATIAGTAAAWWWDLLERPPDGVEVRTSRRLANRSGVRISRRGVPALDRAHRRGVPVTGLALTVLDCAVALGPEPGQAILDRALRRRVSLAQVRAAHFRAIGRGGSPTAARLLRVAADRERQNALVLAGWRVLKVTWRDLRDPARVVGMIRRASAQAA